MSQSGYSGIAAADQVSASRSPQTARNCKRQRASSDGLSSHKPVRSRIVELRENTDSHRNYAPERGEQVVSEYHAAPVTLPKIDWPSARFWS